MVTTPVLIQTAAAVITALAAVGVFGLAWRIFSLVREHDRVLFGEANVQGWDGIVSMVQQNRDRIAEMQANNRLDTPPADD